jgi:serine acetyltransferase
LGDHIYIEPEDIIFGDIVLVDLISIDSNVLVNNSFHTKGAIIAGVQEKIE